MSSPDTAACYSLHLNNEVMFKLTSACAVEWIDEWLYLHVTVTLSCCVLDKVQCLGGVRRHFKAINTHNPQSDLIHPEKNWPQYFQNGLQNEATVILPFMSGSQNLPFFSLQSRRFSEPKPPKTVKALMAISASTSWGFTLAATNH